MIFWAKAIFVNLDQFYPIFYAIFYAGTILFYRMA